jgi:hypothetical protein
MQAKGTACLDAGTKREVRSYFYPIEFLKMLWDVYKYMLVADCTPASGVDVPTVSGDTKPLRRYLASGQPSIKMAPFCSGLIFKLPGPARPSAPSHPPRPINSLYFVTPADTCILIPFRDHFHVGRTELHSRINFLLFLLSRLSLRVVSHAIISVSCIFRVYMRFGGVLRKQHGLLAHHFDSSDIGRSKLCLTMGRASISGYVISGPETSSSSHLRTYCLTRSAFSSMVMGVFRIHINLKTFSVNPVHL